MLLERESIPIAVLKRRSSRRRARRARRAFWSFGFVIMVDVLDNGDTAVCEIVR